MILLAITGRLECVSGVRIKGEQPRVRLERRKQGKPVKCAGSDSTTEVQTLGLRRTRSLLAEYLELLRYSTFVLGLEPSHRGVGLLLFRPQSVPLGVRGSQAGDQVIPGFG